MPKPLDHTHSKPVVSLVVPVYNAGMHLAACIGSLQAQTIRDIEIICIDDGSTDQSPATLRDRAASDPRVRVVSQENSGPAVARNRGMALAQGQYLGFIDADDWVESTFIAHLLEVLRRHDADLARASIMFEYRDHSEAWHGNDYLQERAAAGGELGLNDHGFWVWNALYDLQRLRSLDLAYFDTDCDGLEDMPFTVRVTHRMRRKQAAPEAMYHYRRGEPTQLTHLSLTKIERSLVANRRCIEVANSFDHAEAGDYEKVVSRSLKNLVSHFARGASEIPEQFDLARQHCFYQDLCDLHEQHVDQTRLAAPVTGTLTATLDGQSFEDFQAIAASISCTTTAYLPEHLRKRNVSL